MTIENLSQTEYARCTQEGIGFSSHQSVRPMHRLWLYHYPKDHRYIVSRVSAHSTETLLDLTGDLGHDWINELAKRIRERGLDK